MIKVKLSLCLTKYHTNEDIHCFNKHHTMKTIGGVKV
jgi:hypothetical protein